MYVITINSRPATLKRLMTRERRKDQIHRTGQAELESYISGPTKKKAIDRFLYQFGFTWKERAKGIDVLAVKVVI